MIKMNRFWTQFVFQMFILCIIQNVVSKATEPEYVRIGDYPGLQKKDLNLRECGLRNVDVYRNESFSKQCFQYKYEDRIIWDSHRNPTSDRIFGGKEAEDNEAPWTVYFGCAGSLITFEWIITAAHCLDVSRWGDSITIKAGSNNKDGEESQVSPSNKWFPHPIFKNTSLYKDFHLWGVDLTKRMHDIGLAKVEHKFTKHLSKDKRYLINTICLPNKDWNHKLSFNATVFGWGLMNDDTSFWGNPIYPTNLQKGRVEVNKYCDYDSTLCGKVKERPNEPRICVGDSGGPLVKYIPKPVHRAVLIGTAQGTDVGKPKGEDKGKGQCSTRIKHQYWARVSYFIDWILKTIKNN